MKFSGTLAQRRHPRFGEIQRAWLVVQEASNAGPILEAESAMLALEQLGAIYAEDGTAPTPDGESRHSVRMFVDGELNPTYQPFGRSSETQGPWREHPFWLPRFYPSLAEMAGVTNQFALLCARQIDEGNLDGARKAFGPRGPRTEIQESGHA